jgi:BMFP domain-containing protein YqiC
MAKAFPMTQTTGRFFDELGKLITDAAGAAQGVRKEVEGVVRVQAENILRELDVVQREEFEAVKAMAQKARVENEQLKQRLALLEAILDDVEVERDEPLPNRPIRRRKLKRGY